MGEQAIEALIENLTQELTPVKKLCHPFLRALPWMVASLVYTAAVVSYLGLRPDLAYKLSVPVFLFETGLAFFIGVSAAFSSVWMCVPDMRGQKWLPIVPLTALTVFLFWTVLRAFTEGINFPVPHWDHCFQDGALLGALPVALIVFVSRRGATTRPFFMSIMNFLAVGAFGYVGLRFTCMLDTVGHAGLYHIAPFLVIGMALGLAARHLYRW